MSMMPGRAILVLFVLQALQSWATQCDNDQVAYVQKDLKALKGDALEVTGRTCTGISSGDCNGTEEGAKCTDCDPRASQVIPATGLGFPDGRLACGEKSCHLASGAANEFYQFKNPTDYLTCPASACNNFNVQNVRAVCCSGGSSCRGSNFELSGDHSCGGDVCCHGTRTCGATAGSTGVGTTFSGVRHMVCLGLYACSEVSVSLAGDLVIGGGNFAGIQGNFIFANGGNHCVRTTGSSDLNVMLQATIRFEQPSNARILCDSASRVCSEAVVVLSEGSCLHITCNKNFACNDMQVLPLVAGNTNFQCYCSGTKCGWTSSYSYCSQTSGNPCGTDICPGTAPACLKVGQETTADPLDCDALATAPPCDGEIRGDPHLRTLDGRHYTLLQKGNFLLWAFSGYETEVLVNGAEKKVPVDFELFTHYAGHASFTKGLLLVDQSQKPSQALEMTTKDCLWQHWDTSTWRPVDLGLLNMTDPEGVHFGTFKLAKSKGGQKKLELLIHDGAGPRTLAQLWIFCRPGHQLSAKIKMSSQKDLRFVRGELAPGRLSLAAGLGGTGSEMATAATDAEFAVTSDWAALGGSSAAASYFKMFHTEGSDLASRECTNEDKDEYAKTCRKHLGDSTGALYKEVLDDCIFDLCNGGGETSAELAAEIYHAE